MSVEFGTLLRLVSLMNLILILFHLICSSGREANAGDFVIFCLCWLAFRHLQTDFQTWCDDRHY